VSALRLGLPAPLTGRIGALDELKGVAIILVVLYHCGGVLGWENTLHGEVGVDMFVILSGMGLTLGSSDDGIGRYLARRFWRIYPAYWIALGGFLVADALVRNVHFSALDLGLDFLGIQAWCGDAHAMTVNDSFWFISLIVALYLVYLPVRRLVGRPDRLLLAGALVSIVTALAYLQANQPVGFGHLSLRLPGFFLGLLAGSFLKTAKLEINLSPALAGAALLIFYVPYARGFLFTSVWVGCAVMAVYAFLLRPLLPSKARSDLTFLGERSLEIFLIHQPLIRDYNIYVLQRYFPAVALTPWTMTAGMGVGVIVTVAASDALHRLLVKIAAFGRKPRALAGA
jgi:peptidoglycan/LPS O-acetylase OafA/YrhL